ncbi:unnamed protein product [Urochloa humidicola]
MFLWLAFHRRHWTADRRHRHGLHSHTNCLLCDQLPETMEHILVQCSYAQQVWWPFLQQLGFATVTPTTGSLQVWWTHLRRQVQAQKRKGFDSLFALVSWQIWKERNARVFRGATSQPRQLLQQIKIEGDNWISAGARQLGCLFSVQ